MSLEDILQTAEPSRRGSTCHVETVLEALEDRDRGAIMVALANRDKFSASMIVKVLKQHFAELPHDHPMYGYVIGESSIARHRRGGCRCVQ